MWRVATLLNPRRQQSVSQKLNGHHGHLWQARYYDFNASTPEKRVEKLKYIHLNPVRRGLVSKREGWAWSSYRHYALGGLGAVQIESPSRRGSGDKSANQTPAVVRMSSDPSHGTEIRLSDQSMTSFLSAKYQRFS